MTGVNELKPNVKYNLTLDDCCIQGTLVATFLRYELDEDGDPHAAVFDIGTLGPTWGQWSASEVPQ